MNKAIFVGSGAARDAFSRLGVADVVITPFAVAALALTALSLSGARHAAAQPTFQDQSEDVGLNVLHAPSAQAMGNQWYMSGGIAIADFDRDGDQDVFVLHGSGLDYLFINDGNGNFEDRAQHWGLTEPNAGIGASAADYNNDGWIDLYVTTWGDPGNDDPGPGQHRLYRNDNGKGFTEVAVEAGVNYTSYIDGGGYGSAWGDYDLDGDLDLAVAHWMLNSEGNRLYRNNGDGTFTDVTDQALGDINGNVWGFQPVFADMNGDRYPELLISADFKTSRYYINNGNGTFTELTTPAGLGLDDNGMGNTVADVNNDQLLDWYVTSIYLDNPQPDDNPGNMLYINQGNDAFVEQAANAGCLDGGWGWGTIAVDLDLDGWQDIIEVNGRPNSPWADEQAYLYHNVTTDPNAPQFQEIAVASGLEHIADQTSVAAFDADMDGDRDVLSFANSNSLKYFENTTNSANAWLRVELDTSTNPLLAPDGFGTRVVATVGQQFFARYVDGQPTYLATSAIPLHFGLGDATQIDELTIEWPRGYDTVLNNVDVNQTITIQAPGVGDVNGDGSVNVTDLLNLLGNWGTCPEPPDLCPTDTNGDGEVNVTDLLNLLGNWG